MTRNAAVHREEIDGNLDTSFLKILALLFMLIDHCGVAFFPRTLWLRVVGRMAFPLYAWCLVVGSTKTKSPVKYALRMLGIALIAQPLYMMALDHTWADLNIMFSLLIAFAAIQGIRINKWGTALWMPVLCYLLHGYFKFDYGWKGLTFILILYLLRKDRRSLSIGYLAYALFWGASTNVVRSLFGVQLTFLTLPGLGDLLSALFRLQSLAWLSLPLIVCRIDTGYKMPKWMSYSLYPLHLVILIALQLVNGTQLSFLLRGF